MKYPQIHSQAKISFIPFVILSVVMLHIKTVPSRLVNTLSLCLAGLFVKCWSLVLLILGHLLHVALQCLILLRVVWIRQRVVGVRLSRSPWSPVLLPLLVLLLKKQVSRRAKLIRVSIEVIIFLRIIITDGREARYHSGWQYLYKPFNHEIQLEPRFWPTLALCWPYLLLCRPHHVSCKQHYVSCQPHFLLKTKTSHNK